MLVLEVMNLLLTKVQDSFIRYYRGVREGGNEDGLSKWNPAKIMKYLNM